MKLILSMRIILFTLKLIYVFKKIAVSCTNDPPNHQTWTSNIQDEEYIPFENESPDREKYLAIDSQDEKIDSDSDIDYEVELVTHSARLDPRISKYVDKVKFKLWTISNEEKTVLLKETTLGNEKILKNVWLENLPLKVVIHGWKITTDESDEWCLMVKRAYLEETNEYNVMTVDWTAFSVYNNYFKSAKKCAMVGIIVGQFFDNLVKFGIEIPDNIHFIGHSLGAHVAGFGGRTFFAVNKNKIGRITGLDPSSVAYEPSRFPTKLYESLREDDAQFVDAIYTSIGSFIGLGISVTVGHANFYPNNGTRPQPGCSKFSITCSHGRAYEFYRESISQKESFEAVECSSMKDFRKGKCKDNIRTLMGHNANSRVHGTFYLITSNESPYSMPLPDW